MAVVTVLFFTFITFISGQDQLDGVVKHSYTATEGHLKFEDFENDKATYLEFDRDIKYYPNVTINIKLLKLNLNKDNGDLVIVGPGNATEVFYGAPSLMIVESQEDAQDILVIGKSATIIFVTRNSSTNRSLTVEWKVNGAESDTEFTTQLPTTPVSKADMQAVILCFKEHVSCEKFKDKEENFKRALVNRATRYSDKNDMSVKISIADIRVKCSILSKENKQDTVEKNFLSVTITDKRNPELPVFTTQQLREIIKDFKEDDALGVAECRSYPNYWWWFYGSAIMLGLVVIILSLCWAFSKYDVDQSTLFKGNRPSEKPQCNGKDNSGFTGEDLNELYEKVPNTPNATVNLGKNFKNYKLESPRPPTDFPMFSFPDAGSPTTKFESNPPPLNKNSLTNLNPINEDKIRESAPSLASDDYIVDQSPATRRREFVSRPSQHLYEDLDKLRNVPIQRLHSAEGYNDTSL